MKKMLKTWGFLVVLSLIVSVSLTAVSTGLHGRIVQNMRMVQVSSILDVLDVRGREGLSDAELLALFDEKVVESAQRPGVYYYYEGGALQATAFEAAGQGLWDQIRGLVAVEEDGRTIRGVRFYEQNETPGLGGDIGTTAFESRFEGKKLYLDGEVLRIVRPGTVTDLSDVEVHGITGATLTCERVNVILGEAIERFLDTLEERP